MNHATTQPIDYVVVAAYILLILFVGRYFQHAIRGAADYFAAGNTMPWWVAGMSYYMAAFSTIGFLVYNEIAYTYGFVGFTIMWVHGSTMLVAGLLLGHRWRRARVLTPLGFMERRFSHSVHQLFVWAGFPLRLFDNALRIYGTAVMTNVAIFGVAAGQDIDTGLLLWVIGVLGALFIIYTWMGGQVAVMITDFVQAIIMLLAIIIVSSLCLAQFDGLGDLIRRVPPERWRVAQSIGEKGYDWTYLIFNLFVLTVLNNAAGWALVQKYNCVRSETDVRKMVWFTTFLKMISPPLFFFPGLAARAFMGDQITDSRYAFAQVSFSLLPVGLMGLMLAAMFSASTSTLGAEYNTLSSVLTRDFYKRMLRPGATARQEIAFGRWATLAVGLVTMAIAISFHFSRTLNLMDLMHRYFGAFGPPIFIPVILGLLTRKFNARGVWVGSLAGVSVGLALAWLNLVLVDRYEDRMAAEPMVDWLLRTGYSSMLVVVNCATVVAGMWLGSKLRPRSVEEERKVDAFFADLERPYLIDAGNQATESPFRLIGLTTLWFGGVMLCVAVAVLLIGAGTRAFQLNLLAAGIMIALGLVMWLAAGRRRGSVLGGDVEPR